MTIKAITSTNVILNGSCKPATILYSTQSGKIIEIYEDIVIKSKYDERLKRFDVQEFENFTPLAILPGLVDSHVHLNEPGRSEWEGFETGTQSAISGGVTTVVDMPLNAVPPTTNVTNFNKKIEASNNKLWCDVAFWGGLVPDNLDDLIPLVRAGIHGFKGFLCESGVPEFPNVSQEHILKAMDILKKENVKLLFHAELIETQNDILLGEEVEPHKYNTFLESRPDHFETNGIGMIVQCLENTNIQNDKFGVHIVHLASEQPLSIIELAQSKNLPITVETCFHYLTFSSEEIPDSSPQFKCCPPIRSDENRLALWAALRSGLISSVVSDHSPCTPELKKLVDGNFISAWGGISSVGFNLPLIYTTGLKLPNPITLVEIVKWCCENTAKLSGLENSKGYIKIGHDADFVIFNKNEVASIDNDKCYFRNKLTPYHGMMLRGCVHSTILRGSTVFTKHGFYSRTPMGKTLVDPYIVS